VKGIVTMGFVKISYGSRRAGRKRIGMSKVSECNRGDWSRLVRKVKGYSQWSYEKASRT
jgi:hypothetical protein